MKEKAVTFGPGRSLVGVLCEPKAAAEKCPAVIIMNSGVMHHVGIGRLHVRLARALAVEGITSLRFDLSMVGDSAPMVASVGLGELVQGDIDSALEEVRSTVGIDRFVLAGLCSGARDALDAARRRSDVIGVVSIDLITDLRTWHYYAVYYGSRLLRWRSWRNTITGSNGTLEWIFDKLRGKPPRWDDGIEPEALGLRPPTSRDDLRSGLTQVLARGSK